jgi:hypothetical protein
MDGPSGLMLFGAGLGGGIVTAVVGRLLLFAPVAVYGRRDERFGRARAERWRRPGR